MNVFSGPNSLRDFHDPSKNPPLPLVELPNHPFASHGIRIYAKMLTMLPSTNVKSLAALNMMERAEENKTFNPATDTIVEWSSGNTILSMAILARIRGCKNAATAYISNKTSEQKRQLLRFFGLELKLFGGPIQAEPDDRNSGIGASIEDGKQPNFWNPGQYSNPANAEAHVRWTGPQLAQQLPHISVFSASVGTSGTMTGTGGYLKTVFPDIVNLGVFTAAGDFVPGPRPSNLVHSSNDLPWRQVVNAAEHVDSSGAYAESLELCRQGILCGPSSGLALKGLYQYLEKVTQTPEELDRIRGPDGFVNCVFLCCDLPFQYIKEYFSVLPPSRFPKVHREELLHIDTHPYSTEWRMKPCRLIKMLKGIDTVRTGLVILDLRDTRDFETSSVDILSQTIGFRTVTHNLDIGCARDPNPFRDTPTLVKQWTALSKQLSAISVLFSQRVNQSRPAPLIVVVSYDGATASIACSILRAHDANAYFIEGGFDAWVQADLPLKTRSVQNVDVMLECNCREYGYIL